jgi:hypothetical protein
LNTSISVENFQLTFLCYDLELRYFIHYIYVYKAAIIFGAKETVDENGAATSVWWNSSGCGPEANIGTLLFVDSSAELGSFA